MKKYDTDFIIKGIEKMFPFIEKIERDTKRVWLASSYDDDGKPITENYDIIKIYFMYDNPAFISRVGNNPKKIKKDIYTFIERYFNINPLSYGTTFEIEIYIISPIRLE